MFGAGTSDHGQYWIQLNTQMGMVGCGVGAKVDEGAGLGLGVGWEEREGGGG